MRDAAGDHHIKQNKSDASRTHVMYFLICKDQNILQMRKTFCFHRKETEGLEENSVRGK